MASKLGSKYNHYLSYSISFFSGLQFNLPIWSFFLANFLGFGFAQAATLGVISMITSMIFEVPSGTRADIYGKKKILLIGTAIYVVCMSTYLWAESYSVFVVNELVRGLGSAMISGCLVPLIYDRYEHNDRKDEFNRYSRKSTMITFAGRVLAALVAGYMFLVSPYLPYIGILIATIVRFLLVTQLDEIKIESNETLSSSTLTYIKQGYKDFAAADNGRLKHVSLFFIGGFVFANLLWFVYQPLFTNIGLSITSLGVVYATASGLSLIGSHSTKHLYDGEQYPGYIVKIFLGVLCVTGILLLLLPGLRKLAALVIIQITFGWFWPIMNTYINHSVGPEQRSTVNSILALLSSTDVLIGGVLAGYLFDYFGLGAVYLSLAIGGGVLLVLFVVFGPNKTIVEPVS